MLRSAITQFLKPGGYLAVSEITWITENPEKVTPSDLQFFEEELFKQDNTPYLSLSEMIKGTPSTLEVSLENIHIFQKMNYLLKNMNIIMAVKILDNSTYD